MIAEISRFSIQVYINILMTNLAVVVHHAKCEANYIKARPLLQLWVTAATK